MIFEITTASPIRRRGVFGLPAARRTILELASHHDCFDEMFRAVLRWDGRPGRFGPILVREQEIPA